MTNEVKKPFTKPVTLLKFDDCERRNGIVYVPNTIEMARIKKPGRGQYKKRVKFSTNASEQSVKDTLQAEFPTFDLDVGIRECSSFFWSWVEDQLVGIQTSIPYILSTFILIYDSFCSYLL